MKIMILTMALFFGSTLWAQEGLRPERLLQFADEPGRYILIATENDETKVFDISNGVRRQIEGQVLADFADGGSLEIEFIDGGGLFVPSDQTYNYVDGRTESYFNFPDRARERLVKTRMTKNKLQSLGLADLIAQPSTRDSTWKRMASPTLPRAFHFILLNNVPRDGAQMLTSIGESGCISIGRLGHFLSESRHLIACPESVTPKLDSKIQQMTVRDAEKDFVDGSRFENFEGRIVAANATLADASESFPARLGAVMALHGHAEEWLTDKTIDVTSSIIAVRSVLVEFSAMTNAIEEQSKFEDDATAVLLQERWIGPMRSNFARQLMALDQIDDQRVRTLVFQLADKASGLSLNLVRNNLLDTWIKSITARLARWKEIPEGLTQQQMVADQWKFPASLGGIYPVLNLSGSLTDPTKDYTEAFSRIADAAPYGLVNLGIQGEQNNTSVLARKKIVEFIAQADQFVGTHLAKVNRIRDYAEYTSAYDDLSPLDQTLVRKLWLGSLKAEDLSDTARENWSRWEFSKKRTLDQSFERRFNGSQMLVQFLRNLSLPTPEMKATADFSSNLYALNVLELLTELIENRELLLRTEGTNIAILETAIHFRSELEDTGEGRQVLRSHGMRAKFSRMTRSLEKALAEPYQYVQDAGDRQSCQALLSPRPSGPR